MCAKHLISLSIKLKACASQAFQQKPLQWTHTYFRQVHQTDHILIGVYSRKNVKCIRSEDEVFTRSLEM